MKKFLKFINPLSIILFVTLFLSNNIASAGLLDTNVTKEMDTQTAGLQSQAGYATTVSVGGIVATVIQAFLGLLGIIFVILILTAGYNWMTAAGEEEKINKAKDTIRRAIIGLIIIIAAYSITYFVFSNLEWSGGGTTTNPIGSSG